MTDVQRLIDVLQSNIHSKKDQQSNLSMRYDNDHEQQRFQQLKAQMSKHYRPPWIMTGISQRKQKLMALKNKQLDNWQIARMSLSKRSYVFPKNYHGIKIPSVGQEFSRYNAKDAQGHYPYLYEGDLKKIQKIKQEMHKQTFARTNTIKHEYFGFAKIRLNQTQIRKNKASSYSVG